MVDLSVPRSLAELLGTCGNLYQRYFRVFAGIALFVVVPLDLITLGGIDGYLTSGFSGEDTTIFGGGTGGIAYSIVSLLVTTPLVTAAHVFAVMEAGEGKEPSVRRSLEEAGPVFIKVAATILAVLVCVLLGLIALIVPGLYLYVRFVVSAQAVVAEGLDPVAAMRRSSGLVEGSWWRVFGITIVLALIAGAVSSVVALPMVAAAEAANAGALYVLGQIVADTLGISFAALSGTLLFFDLRARKARPAPAVDAPPAV
jgi:hypothetical protein